MYLKQVIIQLHSMTGKYIPVSTITLWTCTCMLTDLINLITQWTARPTGKLDINVHHEKAPTATEISAFQWPVHVHDVNLTHQSTPWYNCTGWLGIKHQFTYHQSTVTHTQKVWAYMLFQFNSFFFSVLFMTLRPLSESELHLLLPPKHLLLLSPHLTFLSLLNACHYLSWPETSSRFHRWKTKTLVLTKPISFPPSLCPFLGLFLIFNYLFFKADTHMKFKQTAWKWAKVSICGFCMGILNIYVTEALPCFRF